MDLFIIVKSNIENKHVSINISEIKSIFHLGGSFNKNSEIKLKDGSFYYSSESVLSIHENIQDVILKNRL